MSTQSVIEHHVQALAEGNLDEIMADYSVDCVFIANDNCIVGTDRIRAIFQGAVANGGFAVAMQHAVYHDDAAYITWSVPGMILLGTDTFIVKDEAIVLQTNAVALVSA